MNKAIHMRAKKLFSVKMLSFYILFLGLLTTFNFANAQEGTKQLMPANTDQLWLEFNVFGTVGQGFGMYNCAVDKRINIRLKVGEKMYFGMKLRGAYGSNTVITDADNVYFRVKKPSETTPHAFAERRIPKSGTGYIGSYSQAIAGPTGIKLNGTPITGGYTPFTFTATETGDYFIEFRETDFANRFALEYFDVTVTDADDNIITNPNEPNKSAGRLWSKAWQMTNASFTDKKANAFFYVFTSDQFINKINFELFPYSFIFQSNSYGLIKPVSTFNYIERAQSKEGDQTAAASEYRIFLNDPDRGIWPNTRLAPPRVKVWAGETLFFKYNYDSIPQQSPYPDNTVTLEKNRIGCAFSSTAIFKINSNIDGFTAILIDLTGDGVYSTGGSDRVIYRDMRKGNNYILWNYKSDNGAEVAPGTYKASATFLGRGPTHFPMYDVEQLDGVNTSAIRPFKKLNTSVYWDDTKISKWGDPTGKMVDTKQKQLIVGQHTPRLWSWRNLPDSSHNGNLNTMNTWYNAIDLGYSAIVLNVTQSLTKCVDGLVPYVGDIYKDTIPNNSIIFKQIDFTKKFFDPTEQALSSIKILSLPANGNLRFITTSVTIGQVIPYASLGNLNFVPINNWVGKTSFDYNATNAAGKLSFNSEKVYITINTPPTISAIENQNLCTNTYPAIPFTVSDGLETPAANLIVTAYSADPTFVPNNSIVIGGSGTNRTITVTPIKNRSGNAIIYVMVDDGLSQAIQEFAVYVGPDLEFSGDTTVCVNQGLYLVAQETGATSYTWKYIVGSTETVKGTAKTLDLSWGAFSAGNWSLTVSKGSCTSSTRNFTVSISPLTTFSGDVNVCVGETLSLSATEVNATYAWKKGATTVSTSKFFTIPSAALSDAAGNYTLYVNKSGCENTSSSFTISVVNPPSVVPVSGNTVDPDKDGTITVSTSQSGITYNVYQGTTLIASGLGTGANLPIAISYTKLNIGNNLFTIKADNGNCESTINTATIVVRTPGITVSTINGNTTEGGVTAIFTIRLNTQPSANVSIALSSSDITEGTVPPTSITFTPSNYSTNQTITVTGVDDYIIDGNISYTINTAPAISTDAHYNGMDADNVAVINNDNDVASVLVSRTSGLVTTEAGGTDAFTIVLNCQPESNVTILLSSSDPGEGTVSPASISFSSANWNTPQLITVTGINDAIDDDNQIYTINTSNTSSSDSHFNNLNVADVSVTNIDNDDANITVNPMLGLITTEAGGIAQFTVVLNTEPTANVAIGISSSDGTEGTVSTSSLTFTPLNWSIPQTVTITGVNDDIDDDNILYSIITAQATGSDTKYNVINPADVTVTNNDDDIAGLTISKSSITTTEVGGYESFTVKLSTQPTSTITIGIASSNPSEGTVSVGTLSFTTSNWNTAQTVTVTGVDDFIDDGDIDYSVGVSITSGDIKYTSSLNRTILAKNIDNDVAGVNVSPTTIGTTEAGGNASFNLVLASQPTASVTISFTGIDATEGSINKTNVIFTTTNWNTPQSVTVTGLDDVIADGNIIYTIITTATSSYSLYNGITVADVTVTNADNDVAGITVSPTTGLTTTEIGGTATFTISLNTQPTANVTITITSLDPFEGTVSPTIITFTNSNWTAKTITVTGVNDAVADGDITYTVQTSNTTSTDPNYNNKPVNDVTVTNIDDDVAGINVSTISGNTTEVGGTATFSIALTSQPTSDVIIGLSSNDPTEGSVSPASVTFNSSNWNTLQYITVTGVNDDIDDDNVQYSIITSQASSSDSKYSVINPADVTVINTDDDIAGITVTVIPPSGLTTTEAGGTATFTIKLNTRPTADVTIGLNSSNTAEGTVLPASLTFTTGNWSSAQTVTIKGIDDFVDDGDVLYTILTNAALSSDIKYSGMDAANVSVTNIDNDAADIMVTPTTGLTTTEAGGKALFSIVLTSRPTADVTIGLSSSDNTEGTVTPSSVTFSPSDWNSSRTITITGVDDLIDDDNIGYSIITAQATSSDPKYSVINPLDVAVTNTDNDVANITVTPTTGLTTTEAPGGTAIFTIALTSQPTFDVTIGLATSDNTEGTVAPTSITFNATNWNTARTVTITGVDDFIVDGNVPYSILTNAASSADPKYNGMDAANVSVSNTDNDVIGFTIDPISGLYTTEGGGTTSFTVRLTSQPTANVSINLTSSNPSEGIAAPSGLTFTNSSWNSLQTVTVTGQNDDIDDDDIAYSIITQPAVSSDPLYNTYNPTDVSLINKDDDAAGYNFSTTSVTYNESGVPVSLTIALNSKPLSNVVMGFVSENTTKGTVSPASLTFIPTAWNVPQTLNITPVNNFINDGNVSFAITTSADGSSDAKYSGLNPTDITVNCIDNDVAGINISSVTGTTSEDLTSATFTITLNSEPTADVTIVISSDDMSEGIVSPATVTFNSSNWNSPSTITVTGVDDAIADGNQTYHIVIGAASSSDVNYNGVNPDDITMVNSDNDSRGITVFGIEGLITTEAGAAAPITVRLNSQPTADVTIGISSSDISEGTVDKSSITFTPANWNTIQGITVKGVDDLINDGDILYTIILDKAVSDDLGYNNMDVQDVSVTNRDDIGPRASDDAITTNEDTEINIPVLANDKGLDKGLGASPLSITQQPSHGTIIIKTDNTITYQPNGLYNGDDTFTYKVCDVEGNCDEAIVTVTVTGVNDIPVAVPDARGTSKNTAVIVDVLFNDYGLEDGGIVVAIDLAPTQGTAVRNPDNTITYTPAFNYIGIVTFKYKVTDSNGDVSNALVTINVREVNSVPNAIDDEASTIKNKSVEVSVLANDTGLNDGFGRLSCYSNPLHGTVAINPNRTLTYSPATDYTGNDSFRYLIEDADGDYDIATVNVTITEKLNHLPVANPDRRGTNYQTAITVDVLTNDTGLEDGVKSVTISSPPVNGNVLVNPDKTVTYTPNLGFSGIETFGYQVSDIDDDRATANITITVLPDGVINHIPVAVDDDTTTIENTPVNINVLANDSGLEDGFGDLTIHVSPLHGTVTVNTNRTITYSPSNQFIGSDNFQYWIEDIQGDYDIATVNIVVAIRPNYLPIAKDDRRGTNFNTPVKVDVLVNDSGLEDVPIAVSIVTAPIATEGTTVINADNTITFSPFTSYAGTSIFTYRVTDKDGDSDDATVTITVLPNGVTNHTPIALDDDTTTIVNTPVNINVLANDTGLEDGFEALTIYSTPLHGTVAVNLDRTITYTPSNLFIGSDSFRYWVEDIQGDYDIATVNVAVTIKPNRTPVANPDRRGTEFETAVSVDVLSNDTGLEDGGIVVSISTSPNVGEGSATVNGDNTITFTPATGFSGIAVFGYTVKDKDGDSDYALVTITVLPDGVTNHIPIAADDLASTIMNTPVDINVLTNDTGLEDGFGALLIQVAPLHGRVIVNTNRTITYTPSNLFIGGDSFQYWVEDKQGDYSIATVSITVTLKPNYAPVANDDRRGTNFNTPITVDVLVNDSGLEDLPIAVSIVTAPIATEGTTLVNADNTITFTPFTSFAGTSIFSYRVTDKDGDSDDATVTITVLPNGVTNHIPIAADDLASTIVNTPVNINVLANDTGLEDGFWLLKIHASPAHGTALVTGRTITYTPSNLFIGNDSFQYWVEDVHGDYDIATVSITVTVKPNYIPVANDDRRGTNFNTPVIVDVLINDTGLEDVPIAVSIVTAPIATEGTAIVNADNTITFTPFTGYAGTSVFTYKATDKDGDSDNATITITVLPNGVTNHTPVAFDDDTTTIINTPVNINVLANDTGLEDGFWLLKIHASPAHGTALVTGRTITYTPSNLFIGNDSFQYWVEDIHGDYDIATVNITVTLKPNHLPFANDDKRGASFNTGVIVDVLINDTGLEDIPITVSLETPPSTSEGTAVVNIDNTITFTPITDYVGTSIFTYKITDKDGDISNDATVTINVKSGINNVPLALDDAATTTENKAVTINVLANDSQLNDGIEKVIIYRFPRFGTAIVNANYTVTYTPSPWFIGADDFDYMVIDLDGDYGIAKVSITVNPIVNSLPTANDDSRGTSKNTSVIVDVLTNDTGLEDGGLKLTIPSNPSHGTVLVNLDNTITYSPSTDYLGIDNFDYQVCDVNNDCSIATVTINVKEHNFVPIAQDDRFYTGINTTGIFNVLDNDSGLDDGGIKVEVLDLGMAGQAFVNPDNTISYTPITGFEGTDHFAYKVTDVDGDYDIAQVTIVVTSGAIPGFSITPTSLTTGEEGTSTSISVSLTSVPTSNVSIRMTSDDLTEGSVSPATLTFTPTNWSSVQTVTVTGVNDYIIDGSVVYNITASVDNAVSDDNFDPLPDQTIAITNTDNDVAGFTISKTIASTSETGLTDSYTVVLIAQPNSDVVINATSGDITEGSLNSTSLTFSAANWNIPQSVIITGVKDYAIDGNITYNVTMSVIDNSSDDNFDPLPDQIVVVTNADNHLPVAVDDANSINKNGINIIGNIIDNDTDEDGEVLTVVEINSSSSINSILGNYGSLTCDASGQYTYTLDNNNNAVKDLNNGQTLADTFTYTVTDGNGGNSIASLVITINGNTDVEDIFIPKGFSPDGDGISDLFIIAGIENYPDNELTVYNRWGSKVYSKTHYSNNWDGRSDSSKGRLPIATYFYVLKVKGKTFTGYVYIKY